MLVCGELHPDPGDGDPVGDVKNKWCRVAPERGCIRASGTSLTKRSPTQVADHYGYKKEKKNERKIKEKKRSWHVHECPARRRVMF